LPPASTATIQIAGKAAIKSASRNYLFEQVLVQPNATVDVAILLPPAAIGHAVTLDPLDGATLLTNSRQVLVGADRYLRFQFQAPTRPGVCQIALRDGRQERGLQFWVADLQNPQNNPAGALGGN